MFIQEPKMPVEHKLVSKKVYHEISPKVEYRLTYLGLKTKLIVGQLAQFGMENLV